MASQRSRHRRSKKRGNPVLLFVLLGAAGLLFVVVGSVVAYWLWPRGAGLVSRPAPPGFTTVSDSRAGLSVFLPSPAVKQKMLHNQVDGDRTGHLMWSFGAWDDLHTFQLNGYVRSIRLNDGYTPRTDPAELFELLRTYDWGTDIHSPGAFDIVAKDAITLDGQPALELKYQDRPKIMGAPGEAFWKDHNAKVMQDFERAGKRGYYLVTIHGRQIIMIRFWQRGSYPDAGTVDTIKQSFRFVN